MEIAPRLAARLGELATRYELPPAALEQLAILLGRLADPRAPTTVHNSDAAIDVHIADSLTGVPLLAGRGTIADLGSGAGLPALVLAAALPDATVTAVESAGRKAEFIRESAAAMRLENARVTRARAEAWEEGLGACEAVCARALASLSVLCEYAAPLLRPGGLAVFWKGEVDAGELRDGAAATQELGLSELTAHPVTPFEESVRRTLWTCTKVRETPARYPRRTGMALKRPISANSS